LDDEAFGVAFSGRTGQSWALGAPYQAFG
jgi:hypothetical protein